MRAKYISGQQTEYRNTDSIVKFDLEKMRCSGNHSSGSDSPQITLSLCGYSLVIARKYPLNHPNQLPPALPITPESSRAFQQHNHLL